jgi:hypothetical protein
MLRVTATSATGKTSQTNNSTNGNFLATLDYQFLSPTASKNKETDYDTKFAAHAIVSTGYTQVITATNLQPHRLREPPLAQLLLEAAPRLVPQAVAPARPDRPPA